jgi:RNA ligase
VLEIQKYLRSGKTPEDLFTELAIKHYRHPTLPLVAFKYDMLDSPKTHPIVREARGIVLEDKTFKVVGKSFDRFFNIGEDLEDLKNFDWSSFVCDEKLDGSLQILYYYADEWHVNTSGSFGLGEVNFSGKTWRELFWETLDKDPKVLDQYIHLTLIWELCTPYNKVVRAYPKSIVTLLGAFKTNTDNDESPRELPPSEVTYIAKVLDVQRPINYPFKALDEIKEFIRTKENTDKSWEGIVIRDKNNLRAKVKSATYLALHHMADNGQVLNPKRQVPIILAGETDELFAVMKDLMDSTPELKASVEKTITEVNAQWLLLKSVWESTYKIEDQKQYALKIMKGDNGRPMTPFTGILFNLRKTKGKTQSVDDLKTIWRDSADLITKVMYD